MERGKGGEKSDSERGRGNERRRKELFQEKERGERIKEGWQGGL